MFSLIEYRLMVPHLDLKWNGRNEEKRKFALLFPQYTLTVCAETKREMAERRRRKDQGSRSTCSTRRKEQDDERGEEAGRAENPGIQWGKIMKPKRQYLVPAGPPEHFLCSVCPIDLPFSTFPIFTTTNCTLPIPSTPPFASLDIAYLLL